MLPFLIAFCIFLTVASSFPQETSTMKKKYEILLNLCRAIADKGCYLKNYSFLYSLSNASEKKEILKEADKIASELNPYEFSKIDFSLFKRNIIYIISKFSKYRLTKDEKILNNILEEADSLGLYNEAANYAKTHFNMEIKPAKEREDSYFETNTDTQIYKKDFNPNNIGILFLLPLSGKFKHIGEKCIEGIFSAFDFFHYKSRFHLYFFDTNINRDDYNEKLKNFYNNYGNIRIFIGPLESSLETKTVQVAKTIGIPVISLVPQGENSLNYKYYFNHSINLKDEIEQLSDLIKKESYYTGVLYPESSFGLKVKNYFLQEHGAAQTVFIPYPKNTVDFRREIILLGKLEKNKDNEYIQKRDIDSVFIADDIEKALLIIPQLFFYDMKDLKIYGLNLWNSKRILQLEKKYQKSITFLGLVNYFAKNRRFLYFSNYLKKYFNDTPDFYSALLYDTVKILNRLNFETNNSMKESLLNGKFYLLTGETSFDINGMCRKKFKIFKITNGTIEVY